MLPETSHRFHVFECPLFKVPEYAGLAIKFSTQLLGSDLSGQ